MQVADYSKVEYFQPSDSDEEQSDEAGNNVNGQSKNFYLFHFFFLKKIYISLALFPVDLNSTRMLTPA